VATASAFLPKVKEKWEIREKLSNLSEFTREIMVGFTRYYNKRQQRRGYFWGDRFKSVIVEKG
jgi:hypothetical protein